MHNDYYGNKFSYFFGIVREVVDETYVRVRVFGIHPTIDNTTVSDSDLPLAMVLYPVTGDQQGSGAPTHNLTVDSWVYGFWVDYPYCQQPVVTHVLQGTAMSMSTYAGEGGEFVGQGSSSSQDGGDGGELPALGSSGTINLTGNSNPEKVYNYIHDKLVSEGDQLAHLHASAWVGGLMVESFTRIDPAAVNGIGAWGICQWLGPRRKELFRRYGKTTRLDHQLDFMWWEMNNTENKSKRMLLASTNMADAVAAMSMFERAEDVRNGVLDRGHSVYRQRYKYANQVYATLKPRQQTAAFTRAI